MTTEPAIVVATCFQGDHKFSKRPVDSILLVEGKGVEGDAHSGETVQHLSRIARDPSQPNLRQVHLMHVELHRDLNAAGYTISPGDLGENILTTNLDLLALPTNSLLTIGPEVVVQITGLRNPCLQLDNFQSGLTKAVLDQDENGNLIRKAGIMAVVIKGGRVAPGDDIKIEYPARPHHPLQPV